MTNDQKEKFLILLEDLYAEENMFNAYVTSLLLEGDETLEDMNRKIEQSDILMCFLRTYHNNDCFLKIVEDNYIRLINRISA